MTANNIATYPAGGAGAMTLISEQVLGTAVSTVTFASIPQTFKHLRLVIQAQSSQSSLDTLNFNFNGDSGANYNAQSMSASGSATPAAGALTAQVTGYLGNLQGTVSTPNVGCTDVVIANYAGTTFNKSIIGTCQSSGTSGAIVIVFIGSTWASTAAITSMVLKAASASNFSVGSIFTLYGLQ